MNTRKRKELEKIFCAEVGRIFEGNLCFAFIFGSVANNKENIRSDIDMFVCTMEEPNALQQKMFNEFYMKMHCDYGFVPDNEYPGEVVSLRFLQKSIDYIKEWSPQPKIKTYREFEAVFWTAVLAEKKIAVIQIADNVLSTLEKQCGELVLKWKLMVTNKVLSNDIYVSSLLEVLKNEGYKFLEQHRS